MTSWAPSTDGNVDIIDDNGTSFVIGGVFREVNGVRTGSLVRIDPTTGAVQ